MSRVKIPYTSVIKGRRYWQAKAHMREAGFTTRSFGPEGPEAQAAALAFYQEWLRYLGRGPASVAEAPATAAKTYPAGSVGEAWQRFTRLPAWQQLGEGTRQKEWWPAWTLRIEPAFGRMLPASITVEEISEWREHVIAKKGIGVAHKAIKVWRGLWKAMAAMKLCNPDGDPSRIIRNTEPAPRHQQWREGEVVRLVKAAIRGGEHGLACIIAIAWDTGFSPVDVHTLTAKLLATDDAGRYAFDRRESGRTKTGVAAYGTLSARTDRLVRAFLAQRTGGAEPIPSMLLFPNRKGSAWASTALSHAFAKLREKVFPGDARQMRDLRRSAAVEAFAGGADVADVAHKSANSLNRSNKLFKTYVPVDVEPIKRADEARKAGRAAIRARNEK